MKLCVFNPVLYSLSLEDTLKYLSKNGVTALELGAGGYPGTTHADARELIKNPDDIKKLKELFKKYKIEIAAISVHGNPVHPDKKIAEKYNDDFEACCLLAEQLKVKHIVTFSGCPGDKTSLYPNWVTCAWPNDFSELLKWQWEEVLIPYWKNAAEFAKKHKIDYIALEMHPGFCVYNPETLLKLRNAVGDIIGANFDPSHLFWQGINPEQAILKLGKAIHYFHAKDTYLNDANISINGVLDAKTYSDELNRSWVFRTVGYGHDALCWKKIISALKIIGYDYVISIEHEDSYMTPNEGLEKAIKFLKEVMIFDTQKTDIWWI
jgi:sugar phosphate isomerase/epimerase